MLRSAATNVLRPLGCHGSGLLVHSGSSETVVLPAVRSQHRSVTEAGKPSWRSHSYCFLIHTWSRVILRYTVACSGENSRDELLPFALKESLFTSHLQVTALGDVIVLDRGYADYGGMAFLLHPQGDLVIRMPWHRAGATQAFWDEQEQGAELVVPERQSACVKHHGLALRLQVRFVKLALADGEIELAVSF